MVLNTCKQLGTENSKPSVRKFDLALFFMFRKLQKAYRICQFCHLFACSTFQQAFLMKVK